MKKLMLTAAIGLGWMLLMGATYAHGQKNDGKAGNTAATEPCLDFPINVVSIGTNSSKMYWRTADCIRIKLENNPFIYNYILEVNEEKIPEDDILGTLGKPLGISTPSSVNTAQSTTHAKNDKIAAADVEKTQTEMFTKILGAQGADAGSQRLINNKFAPLLDKYSVDTQAQVEKGTQPTYPFSELQADLNKTTNDAKDLDKPTKQKLHDVIDRGIPGCESASATSGTWQTEADNLDVIAKMLSGALQEKEETYRKLWLEAAWLPLFDQKVESNEIQARALKLKANLAEAAKKPDPNYPPDGFESKFVEFARTASVLHAQVKSAVGCTSVNDQAALNRLMAQLDSSGTDVVLTACRYKAKKDGDFSAVKTGLQQPLEDILQEPLAFSWEYRRRVGPYGEPTGISVVLKRDELKKHLAVPVPGAVQYDCLGDPSDMFNAGATYHQFEDFFKPAKQSNAKAGGDPWNSNALVDDSQSQLSVIAPRRKGADRSAGNDTQPKDSTAKTTDALPTTVALDQSWYFGKPRTIVSGGITAGFLRKQEFQRSNSIISGQSQPVIGLKTNSAIRVTPMLYGHVLLPFEGSGHSPEAWYATLGVTANSDTKGTSPEFLVGISRSIANQKFFLTAGAYIGERQKLDGVLQVGQVIPSTLTGELPVTKGYHAGFGFGLSFRFGSSKDPKKDVPATKPATKSGN